MTEIKPKWKDGEPVCDRDCPSFGRMSTGTAYVHNEHCRITGLQFNEIDDEMHQGYKFVQNGHICIPGLRQQRDEYKARVKELEEGIRRFMIPWAPHLPVCWRKHFEDLTAPIFCGLRDVEGTDQ